MHLILIGLLFAINLSGTKQHTLDCGVGGVARRGRCLDLRRTALSRRVQLLLLPYQVRHYYGL